MTRRRRAEESSLAFCRSAARLSSRIEIVSASGQMRAVAASIGAIASRVAWMRASLGIAFDHSFLQWCLINVSGGYRLPLDCFGNVTPESVRVDVTAKITRALRLVVQHVVDRLSDRGARLDQLGHAALFSKPR